MSVLLLEVLIERKLGWGCFFVRIKAGEGCLRTMSVEFMPGAYVV